MITAVTAVTRVLITPNRDAAGYADHASDATVSTRKASSDAGTRCRARGGCLAAASVIAPPSRTTTIAPNPPPRACRDREHEKSQQRCGPPVPREGGMFGGGERDRATEQNECYRAKPPPAEEVSPELARKDGEKCEGRVRVDEGDTAISHGDKASGWLGSLSVQYERWRRGPKLPVSEVGKGLLRGVCGVQHALPTRIWTSAVTPGCVRVQGCARARRRNCSVTLPCVRGAVEFVPGEGALRGLLRGV